MAVRICFVFANLLLHIRSISYAKRDVRFEFLTAVRICFVFANLLLHIGNINYARREDVRFLLLMAVKICFEFGILLCRLWSSAAGKLSSLLWRCFALLSLPMDEFPLSFGFAGCHGILRSLLCSHTFGELISFPASILSTFLHAFKAFFARKALPSYRTSENHGEFVTSFGCEDCKQAPDSNKWNLFSQWKTPMQFLKWIYRQEVWMEEMLVLVFIWKGSICPKETTVSTLECCWV